MTENEAIEVMKTNYPKTCKRVDGRLKGGFDDTECKLGQALTLSIQALEEVQQYHAIGTVEEFKGLKEKSVPKKPKQSGVYDNKGEFHPINGIDGVPYDLCPCCEINLCTDGFLGRDKKRMNYCENCGQRLDWSLITK